MRRVQAVQPRELFEYNGRARQGDEQPDDRHARERSAEQGRDNAARWAFIIAGVGWFVGTVLAIALDRSPLDV